jgi:hypothetical protein
VRVWCQILVSMKLNLLIDSDKSIYDILSPIYIKSLEINLLTHPFQPVWHGGSV